jgi:hypothetical protein
MKGRRQMTDQLAKQQACQLFIEQEIEKGIAEGKSKPAIGREIRKWLGDHLGLDYKARTIEQRARRIESATKVATVENSGTDSKVVPQDVPATILAGREKRRIDRLGRVDRFRRGLNCMPDDLRKIIESGKSGMSELDVCNYPKLLGRKQGELLYSVLNGTYKSPHPMSMVLKIGDAGLIDLKMVWNDASEDHRREFLRQLPSEYSDVLVPDTVHIAELETKIAELTAALNKAQAEKI